MIIFSKVFEQIEAFANISMS